MKTKEQTNRSIGGPGGIGEIQINGVNLTYRDAAKLNLLPNLSKKPTNKGIMTNKQNNLEDFEQEIASNSYRADQHEENEMIIKSSRVFEITNEHILNREKKQREEIVEMVKNTPKYKQDKSCVPNRTRIKTIKEYKQDIINSLNK